MNSGVSTVQRTGMRGDTPALGSKTKVAVVEDHVLVRQSLMKTIAAEDGFDVVGEAGRGDEVPALVESVSPDVVLLDIEIPGEDGLQVAAKLRRAHPDVRIVFLTMHDDEGSIRRAIGIGADGFVPKTASTDELLRALRAVAEGGSYLSPGIARRVMDLAGGRRGGPLGALTERELEILNLIARGMHPSDVAGKLFVSVKTVKNHLTSVYTKLGVKTGAQAVAAAYRQGLVVSAV